MLILLGTLLSGAAPANDELGIGAYIGHFAAPADGPQTSGPTLGFRVRYRFTDRWAVEGAAGGFGEPMDPRLELHYFLNPDIGANLQPFLAGGWGAFVLEGHPNDLWDAGVGLNAQLTPVLDWRTDLRYRVLHVNMETEGGFFGTTGVELHTPRVKPPPPPPPDTDGDGFIDSADMCPIEAEDLDAYVDTDGCPDPDNDTDGVLDSFDACPMVAEDPDTFQDQDGCPDPDNDGDTLLDGVDQCPNEAEVFNGWQDKEGCPDDLPAEIKKFSGKIAGIKFETGKDRIRSESYRTLNEAAAVLLKFPEIRLEVQGHTDDVGDDARNLDLSQRRAQAVVNYLIKKGVPADRLVAKGYGETTPVAANDTSANRALNRRVEFLILK
jgi:outer membrane protein OmpA-like peptidoglycan-associated protein